MTGFRRHGLLALALALAGAGGATAIAVGKAAGWLDGETTVLRTATVAASVESSAAPAAAGLFDPAAIYRERSAGVVTIYALVPAGDDEGGAQVQGSGFVVSREGVILTSSHVITNAGESAAGTGEVTGASEVYVEFKDGDRVSAEIVGWDVFDDVGVLRVDPADHLVEPVPLGDSSSVAVGEPVAAIGSPFGQAGSLAVGVVSATERAVSSLTSVYSVVGAIQTDAPINRGNSGGPLFNARGEVIGINAQIRSESGNAEGVGFAIPINAARRSMEQLLEHGSVEYAWLGVTTQTLTPSIAAELGYREDAGAAIQEVVPRSPAERAGLRAGRETVLVEGVTFRAGGDVILAIDGSAVATTEDLIRIVAGALVPGETAELVVLRGGERVIVPLVLGERPVDPDAAR
ncbi:MAG: trypsin-like peptidase domain-containing protein [Thermoleophilia bacterium]|nr:trypsin-like peptidase domain-containing protein [Thermoleophilia bacterium]